MAATHYPVVLLLFQLVLQAVCSAFLFEAAEPQDSQASKPPAPLEVQLTDSMRWENGCLAAGLEIVNRSARSLLLTKMGPYFYVALDVSKDDSKSGGAVEWVNIYGITDILSLDS